MIASVDIFGMVGTCCDILPVSPPEYLNCFRPRFTLIPIMRTVKTILMQIHLIWIEGL